MQPQYSGPIKDLLRCTVGRLSNTVLPATTRFVVLSSGRSGSNHLTFLMKSHPRIVQNGEIFGEFQLESPSVRARINRAGVATYLDQRLERMGIERATGVKILYYNLTAEYGLARGIPGTETLKHQIAHDPALRIIHLVRQDKLATLVSHKLALGSRQWVGGNYGQKTVHLDPGWVREQFEKFEEWENWVKDTFPANRLLQMTYEDLIADQSEELAKVFGFLCVPPAPVHSALSKQNKRPKSEVVENFAQLRSAFEGTRFKSLFED